MHDSQLVLVEKPGHVHQVKALIAHADERRFLISIKMLTYKVSMVWHDEHDVPKSILPVLMSLSRRYGTWPSTME